LSKVSYIIKIQFLGFRYSGWQKQPNSKTVQELVDKTFFCIFEHHDFKTLGGGRTDSKVSANEFPFQLFLSEAIDPVQLLEDLKQNLPPDIKVLSVETADPSFSVISQSKTKQYQYVFSWGETIHPFCAPFIVHFKGELEIEKIQEGALLFEGEHCFKNYCYKPSEKTQFVRKVIRCVVRENEEYQGGFFPEKSWVFEVESSGFLRYQVRMMMGALIRLGRGEISLQNIAESLIVGGGFRENFIVPSSGLVLNKIEFFNDWPAKG